MPKLHELIAVRDNQLGQATKVRTEQAATFKGKRHLYEGRTKTFRSNEENVEPVVEDQQDIQATIGEEIAFVAKHVAKAIDISYQTDLGNMTAVADLVLEDGTVLATNVPATALLQMGHRLEEIKALIDAIPTLDPAKGFTPDSTAPKPSIYKAREVVNTRTKKVNVPVLLAAAVGNHPAQVQMGVEDRPVGTVLTQEWSGLLTPSTKSDLLEHVEELIRAVTRAKSRANSIEVDITGKKIGAAMLDYVFRPLKSA